MTNVLECTDCGCCWPGDLHRQWGRTKETDGYGPTLKCVALVPAPHAPAARDSSGRVTDEIPLQVCGCALVSRPLTKEDKVRALSPIPLR